MKKEKYLKFDYFLAATKLPCELSYPSVRPSVCPSHLLHYVPSIASSWNIQESLPMTEVMFMQMIKVRGQRSRSQRSNTIKPFPDCSPSFTSYMVMIWCLMWHSRGAISFFKVIHQISRSRGTTKSLILTQIGHFRSLTLVWIHWWLWDDT